jgi:hypothetical protein
MEGLKRFLYIHSACSIHFGITRHSSLGESIRLILREVGASSCCYPAQCNGGVDIQSLGLPFVSPALCRLAPMDEAISWRSLNCSGGYAHRG